PSGYVVRVARRRSLERKTGAHDMTRRLTLAIACALLAPSVATAPLGAQDTDPFLWLEEVEGDRALGWVREHNDKTLADLSAHPVYQPIYDSILTIYNSSDRI